MSGETKTCWGVFSRTGKRTHFRICVATQDEARAELARLRDEDTSQDEFWVAELEADAEAWARSMNIFKSKAGEIAQ